jgi:two-component system, response regulator PdtaR
MGSPKPLRIFVAEDNPVIRATTKAVLEKMGYVVVGEAEDGEQAVERVASLCPDAVLMDIDMPGIDGLEATRRIQANRPTPVVILTAYDLREMVTKASEAGAGAFLIKPLEPDDVDRAIAIARARFEDMVALRRANAELQCRNEENERILAKLTQALADVRILSGMLPICSGCKKIRDDEGYWQQVDTYIRDHSQAEFSHSICPHCAEEMYGEFMEES